jgi:KUP system potassium uptake protein
VVPTLGEGMSIWREKLASMAHNSASEAESPKLPARRVIELGTPLEIQPAAPAQRQA